MSEARPIRSSPARERNLGRTFIVCWLVLSAIGAVLMGFVVGPIIPPGNGSVQATGQVFDNEVLSAVSAPICVFVVLFLAFALTAFRSDGTGREGASLRGDTRIQVLWLVITTVIVVALAAFGSYELIKDGAGGGQGPSAAFLPSGHSKAIDVQVIGQQWEFTYRYPSYGGLETPHLVLPANTLIRLHVTSLDVIHSFWAYQLGVKADANPGSDNVVYVKTNGPLSFQIRCSELCGLWHGYMFDTGKVVPPAQFTSWIKQQQAYFKPVAKYLPPYSNEYLPQPQLRAG